MSQELFEGRCVADEVDPITQESLSETEDVIVLIPEDRRQAGFCIGRQNLLDYWNTDLSWVFGDCRGTTTLVEGYPNLFCRKYYKLPHTNNFFISGAVDVIRNNPNVVVWIIRATDRRVNIGRWMHYQGETNIPNTTVYYIRPSTIDTLEEDLESEFDFSSQYPTPTGWGEDPPPRYWINEHINEPNAPVDEEGTEGDGSRDPRMHELLRRVRRIVTEEQEESEADRRVREEIEVAEYEARNEETLEWIREIDEEFHDEYPTVDERIRETIRIRDIIRADRGDLVEITDQRLLDIIASRDIDMIMRELVVPNRSLRYYTELLYLIDSYTDLEVEALVRLHHLYMDEPLPDNADQLIAINRKLSAAVYSSLIVTIAYNIVSEPYIGVQNLERIYNPLISDMLKLSLLDFSIIAEIKYLTEYSILVYKNYLDDANFVNTKTPFYMNYIVVAFPNDVIPWNDYLENNEFILFAPESTYRIIEEGLMRYEGDYIRLAERALIARNMILITMLYRQDILVNTDIRHLIDVDTQRFNGRLVPELQELMRP